MYNQHGMVDMAIVTSVRRMLQDKHKEDQKILQVIEEISVDDDISPEELQVTKLAYEEVKYRLYYTGLLETLWSQIYDVQQQLAGLHVYESLEQNCLDGDTSSAMDFHMAELEDVEVPEVVRELMLSYHKPLVERPTGPMMVKPSNRVMRKEPQAMTVKQKQPLVVKKRQDVTVTHPSPLTVTPQQTRVTMQEDVGEHRASSSLRTVLADEEHKHAKVDMNEMAQSDAHAREDKERPTFHAMSHEDLQKTKKKHKNKDKKKDKNKDTDTQSQATGDASPDVTAVEVLVDELIAGMSWKKLVKKLAKQHYKEEKKKQKKQKKRKKAKQKETILHGLDQRAAMKRCVCKKKKDRCTC